MCNCQIAVQISRKLKDCRINKLHKLQKHEEILNTKLTKISHLFVNACFDAEHQVHSYKITHNYSRYLISYCEQLSFLRIELLFTHIGAREENNGNSTLVVRVTRCS